MHGGWDLHSRAVDGAWDPRRDNAGQLTATEGYVRASHLQLSLLFY